MALTIRVALLAGALAATTTIAAPVAAAPLPSAPPAVAPPANFDVSRYDPAADTADWRRRCRWGCGWGGWGGRWGGGWGRRGWRRNRIDAGDVLVGAAILGGVAAIVSSNNRRQRDRDVVVVDRNVPQNQWRGDGFRDDNFRNDDRRSNGRTAASGNGASGLDNAVTMCLDRIERDVRVDAVDNVERTGAGWQVSGVLFNGSPFQCRIGNGGQIDGIDYGGGFSGSAFNGSDAAGQRGTDGQWSDQSYAAARRAVGGTVRPDLAVSETQVQPDVAAPRRAAASTAMPAYPGGPIPGEVIPETDEEANGG